MSTYSISIRGDLYAKLRAHSLATGVSLPSLVAQLTAELPVLEPAPSTAIEISDRAHQALRRETDRRRYHDKTAAMASVLDELINQALDGVLVQRGKPRLIGSASSQLMIAMQRMSWALGREIGTAAGLRDSSWRSALSWLVDNGLVLAVGTRGKRRYQLTSRLVVGEAERATSGERAAC